MELVTKRQPVFANQNDEAVDCSVVGVQKLLSESTHLCRSIPAVGTMHKHVCLLVENLLNYHVCSLQNSLNQPEVARSLHSLQVGRRASKICRLVDQFLQATVNLCDLVDVVDVAELNVSVFVILLTFKSSVLYSVRLGIELGTSVIDHHPRVADDRLFRSCSSAYFEDHLLVFDRAPIHNPVHTLRRTPNRAPIIRVEVAEGGKAVFGSEFRAFDDFTLVHTPRKDQELWVSFAELKI